MDIIFGLIIFVYFGYLVTYFLITFWKDYSDTHKTKQKEEAEHLFWLTNVEPKNRLLHTYPEDWGVRRRVIAKRYNYACQICGRCGWLGFHVHHKTPLSRGGDNSLENLTYLCQFCHENQHPHMIEKRNRMLKKREDVMRKAHWKKYWIRKRKYKIS